MLSFLSGEATNEPLMTGPQVALTFVCFVALVFLILLIKKIYYRYRWHRRFYIVPRIRIKGITNVAMTISLSISIILLLTVITSGFLGVIFRAYPGFRVMIEGILIHIGGLLFGPFIGLIIGGITDLLSVALTAGMFHYGFFIISLAYGFIAGLYKSMLISFKNNTFKYSIFASLIYVAIVALICVYIFIQPYQNFKISLFSKDFIIEKWMLILPPVITAGLVLIIIWIVTFATNWNYGRMVLLKARYNIHFGLKNKYLFNKMNSSKYSSYYAIKHARWYAKHILQIQRLQNKIVSYQTKWETIKRKNDWTDCLAQTMLYVFAVDVIANSFLIPYFDVSYSTFGFDYWLAIRTITCPLFSIIDLAVVFPTYKVVSSLVQYDYNNDRMENISQSYLR